MMTDSERLTCPDSGNAWELNDQERLNERRRSLRESGIKEART
jgi:hypothetical protein